MSENTFIKEILDIDKQLKDFQPIINKVKRLKEDRQYLLDKAVEFAKAENNFDVGDHLKLKNIPKKSNFIPPKKFFDAYREIFFDIVKVPIGEATELLGKNGLEGIIETEYKDNWQILDLALYKEKLERNRGEQ
jgi:hypothetical protein